MVNRVFAKLNKEATKAAFKAYLLESKDWCLKAKQYFPGLHSPSMDGQPHGTPAEHDKQFVEHAEADFEYKRRLACCDQLASIGEDEEELADILRHRYIKGWSAIRTMMYINDKYNEALDGRSYRRKQDLALWEGALVCPDDSVRILKGHEDQETAPDDT